tara:strand:+ start:1183 stop:1686 length:504 start_codon:yes stop_codon:yes gene_type:complete
MKTNLVKFFAIQRKIFGICPCCGDIFRLSDTQIYTKEKPAADWMEKIVQARAKLEQKMEKIESQKGKIQELSRKKGRNQANKTIKKVDKVFTPNGYSAEDIKAIFHPVDFVVFAGKNEMTKNLILFDGEKKEKDQKILQKSIKKTIDDQKYEWITMRVSEEGVVEHK